MCGERVDHTQPSTQSPTKRFVVRDRKGPPLADNKTKQCTLTQHSCSCRTHCFVPFFWFPFFILLLCVHFWLRTVHHLHLSLLKPIHPICSSALPFNTQKYHDTHIFAKTVIDRKPTNRSSLLPFSVDSARFFLLSFSTHSHLQYIFLSILPPPLLLTSYFYFLHIQRFFGYVERLKTSYTPPPLRHTSSSNPEISHTLLHTRPKSSLEPLSSAHSSPHTTLIHHFVHGRHFSFCLATIHHSVIIFHTHCISFQLPDLLILVSHHP